MLRRCNGKRGWFPSNYVHIVSEGEAVAPLLSPADEDSIMNLKFKELINSSSESFEQPVTENWLNENGNK